MKNIVMTFILLTVCCVTGLSQGSQKRDLYSFLNRTDAGISDEERIVRKAYDKTVLLCKAHERYLQKYPRSETLGNAPAQINFDITFLNSGDISDVLDRPINELTTWPSGEIVTLSRVSLSYNRSDIQRIGYEAQWRPSQYVFLLERERQTLKERFEVSSPDYANVRRYATYEVTVSLNGKSRSYKAIALFHALPRSADAYRVQFYDSIAGLGGSITEIYDEQLEPYGGIADHPKEIFDERNENDFPSSFMTAAACVKCKEYNFAGVVVSLGNSDNADHLRDGSHWYQSDAQGQCTIYPETCEQHCHVGMLGYNGESGNDRRTINEHVCRGTSNGNDGGSQDRGETTCNSAYGVACSSCPDASCTVSVSVSIGAGNLGGFEVTTSGGNLWNSGKGYGYKCKAKK